MKKYLLFVFLVLPAIVFAEKNTCIQKLQPAISTSGVCRVFSTPCRVPTNWTKIDSCKNTPSYDNHRKNYTLDTSTSKTKVYSSRRFGAGSYTRFRKKTSKKRITSPDRLTSNRKSYNRNALNRARNLSSKKANYRNDYYVSKEKQYLNKKQKWGGRRPPMISRTDGNRTGDLNILSRKERIQNINNRFRERKVGASKYWNNPEFRKRLKKKYIPRTIRLRTQWKGDRLEGNLDGVISD